jgi:hypothetical protein
MIGNATRPCCHKSHARQQQLLLVVLLVQLLQLLLLWLLHDWHSHGQGTGAIWLHDWHLTCSTRVHCHRAPTPVAHGGGCHDWHHHHLHTRGVTR